MQVNLNESGGLSSEQLETFKENFRLIDGNRDGLLTLAEVGVLFRGLGQNPTDEELDKKLKLLPADGVNFDTFLQFFQEQYRPPTSKDVLCQAFQVFDLGDQGQMSAEKFRELLQSMGEPLPPSEIDAILKEAQVDERGFFDYSGLAQVLCDGPKGIPSQ
eukprot:gnl/MRDRNA2_/MRDRNA2_90723_c0_seq1.p1 gnl/MRDRNA2_/MRDRNA2_90723_c0~~gnl/MRDRNA2_/MRDRNA2_90723_c0_seq1.p1  ORF type:complete len:160 (+),score=48.84 gnl/MRDRNA2_/MRDRNA2_90723_c0_seq1:87-566(+)